MFLRFTFLTLLGFTILTATDAKICDDANTCSSLIALTSCVGEAGSKVLTAVRKVFPDKQIRCIVRLGTKKNLDHLSNLESVRHVDFLDAESTTRALEGIDSVFINTPPSLEAKAMRTNFAEACKANPTLRHIVLIGEAVDIHWYGIAEYWDRAKAGEEVIQRVGIPMTVLHPSFFMETYETHFGNAEQVRTGDYFSRVGNKPCSYTSLDDLAEVAAKVLLEGPEKHGFYKYNLISQVLTGDEIAEAMTEVVGRKIEYRPITVQDFVQASEQAGAPQLFIDGYAAALERVDQGYFARGDRGQLEELLGHPPRTITDALMSFKHVFEKDVETKRAAHK